MTELTIEQFIEEYERYSKIIWEGEISKTPNFNNLESARDHTYKMWDQYKNDTDFIVQCIQMLKKSANPSTRLDAANYSLQMNYDVKEAVKILEEIKSGDYYGLWGYAYILLEEWKKNNV